MRCFALCAVVCLAAPSLFAATLRVPADHATIQAALNAAANGDDIAVSAGTYRERIDFKGKNVRLHSVSGAAATVLDGGQGGPVVTFANNETSAAVIDGFTIQNGGGNAGGLDEGGGIAVGGSAPTIRNNIIQDNKVGYAGGGIGIGFGSPTIENNLIRRNVQTGGIGGGGISTRGGSPIIRGNTIVDNTAASFGGGLSFWASGEPVIRNNVILRNRGWDAGGIAFVNGGTPIIEQNLVASNTGQVGGISGPQGTIVNNTIVDNTGSIASAVGGFFGGSTVVENNIFASGQGQTLIACSGNPPQPKNNLLFAPNEVVLANCPTILGVSGNKNADPLFICPAGGNYRLQPSSPAIDAGNSTVARQTTDLAGATRIVAGSPQGQAVVDIGAYEFQGPSAIAISPNTLNFADQIVGSSSLVQSLTISNTGSRRGSFCVVPPTSDFQVASDCGAGLEAGATCSVQVTFAPMREGARTGSVVVASDSVDSPKTVTLTGTGLNPAPQMNSIAPSAAVVNGPAMTIQVTGSGFVPTSVVQWNGTNLATTFVSSTVLTAAVASANLGSIGGADVQVVSPGPGGGTTATRRFTISGPAVTSNGLVNGANYSAELGAGSYAALFGTNLASSTASARTVPLPTTLASVSVLMNGFAAPLFFVSPGQINLQVPWELGASSDVEVIVTTNGVSAAPIRASLRPVAPGLLSANAQGSGQGAILVAGTTQTASPARPVNRTEAVAIYAVGLGPVSNPPNSGTSAPLNALVQTLNVPTVTFGGVPGRVLFSGLAPGLIGVYQVNVQLPLNAPSGAAVPVGLRIGEVDSNTVTIAIQ